MLIGLKKQAGGGAPAAGHKSKSKKGKGKKEKKAKGDGGKRKKPKRVWAAKGEGKNAKKKKKKNFKAAQPTWVNKTPAGEKKDLSGEMQAAYHPAQVEAAWNAWWEKRGFFSADNVKAAAAGADDKFVICLPPPNVTGSLHLGHALTCAIEDGLARWHRMCGRHVMWLPGTDFTRFFCALTWLAGLSSPSA